MHLQELKIKNFRGIENIEVVFDGLVNVIIGPNAIGKTTVLEAIRLNKAILAPRTQNETNQTLISLGAYSPHMTQRFFPSALTINSTIPLIIKCSYKTENAEITKIVSLKQHIITKIVLQNAGLAFANPNQTIPYLSSHQGNEAIRNTSSEVDAAINLLETRKCLDLNLTIDFNSNQVSGEFPIQHIFFSELEQSLDPNKAYFSYFTKASSF